MPVTHVATGTVATTSGTSLNIQSPAGLSGDLCLFFLMHDDYSDGGSVAASGSTITRTKFWDGVPQAAEPKTGGSAPTADHRGHFWWGIENQDAARNHAFSGLGASEEIKGVCIRLRGHDPTTPILAGSLMTGAQGWWYPTFAEVQGSMAVGVMYDDANIGAQTPPTGWTERVDSPATGNSLYVATYEFNEFSPFPRGTNTTGGGPANSRGVSFTISPASTGSNELGGVTYDNDGEILPSCEVSLFIELATGVYSFVDSQTSDGTTGEYLFTGLTHDAAAYMVYARKDGTPNVFDATDNNLDPV